MLRDCDGADIVSDDAGRIEVDDGRFAGRLVDLRVAGRALRAVGPGRDAVDRGLLDLDAAAPAPPAPPELGADSLERADLAALDDEPRADVLRDVARRGEVRDDVLPDDELREDGRVDDEARDDGRVDTLRDVVVLRAVVLRPAARPAGAAAAGLAVDIVLAAAVSAFAAVIIALVAVFIDFMAVDIVCADAVAFVAAAVILVAADVTLVAADDTVLAAVAGVAELRLARLPELLRVVVEPLAPPARLAVLLRPVLDVLADDLELELDPGRLAVPRDALRLTDLLRAVLAGLRRVAARVVD